MDHRRLREATSQANRDLARLGLVVLAFGNASVVDRARGLVAIKPSGIVCAMVHPADLVILDLASGERVAGRSRPSSDTPTHLELYRRFPGIGAVIHTHSPFATAWAQAGREIPALGTTHADLFRGSIPVTRSLESSEIDADYEAATGRVIAERFSAAIEPLEMPAVLVVSHGPFVWGETPAQALDNATALEHVAAIATYQAAIGPLEPLPAALLDRHFSRKHGPTAYYGQPMTSDPGS